jgi:cytosine/adenosine deaminase-related metal-dependent hydrolase
MIYRARYVLPITDLPIKDGEVCVREGVIAAVGQNLAAIFKDEQVEDLGNSAILPGLVNTHTHLDYTVMRGLAEDKPFIPWLLTLVQYGARLNQDDFLASCRLGALQMVRSGITTIADASYTGSSVHAAVEAGLRGIVCKETFGGDPPDSFVDEMAQSIADLQEKASNRISVGISPHTPYTSSEGRLRAVADMSRSNNLPVIVHLAESSDEGEAVSNASGPLAQFGNLAGVTFHKTGVSSAAYLQRVGILGERTIAAHCVHITNDDIAILKKTQTGVAHCPKSNAKLGVGVAPFKNMLSAGLKVGIGTDSSVSNDSLDMFEEMRFALLLQRAVCQDVSVVNTRQILEAATLGGAKVLGMDSIIGSIEPGKRADLIAVDISNASAFPATDPYSTIVYTRSATDVILTMIDGEVIYKDGRFSRVDPKEVMEHASLAAEKLHGKTSEGSMEAFFGGNGT